MCVCIHTSTYYLHTYLLCEKEKIEKNAISAYLYGEKRKSKPENNEMSYLEGVGGRERGTGRV